jgi:DNA/RNA endonuclease G (NUC1)
MCDGRGVVVVRYPQDGIQNGSPDGFALVDAGGQVVEFLSYEGAFAGVGGPAGGLVAVDIGVAESSVPIGQSLSRTATGTWLAPAPATMGACNSGVGPAPPPQTAFSFSGRSPTGDPALPVGFQDQLFVVVRVLDTDGTLDTVTTPVTWSTDTPALASVDEDGVITALAAGTAAFRATTADGVVSPPYALPTRVAVASATAQYAGNAEFGVPADGDPSDDILVVRPQFTASYSPTRNIPNWVSYDLDATHFGAEDRCDCFTFDPTLPPALPRYTTAAYTGAGAFAGHGIDRGHLVRSFDRTSGSLDNAVSFYFTNIIPQAADLNQGPWAVMETHLGDLARLQNREVYIIAGASGSKGTVKGEGLITIPASVWKVAVILPRDQGLAHVTSWRDLEVIAAIMPNDPGVRDTDWRTFETTVDAVEALSGYDLLALLPDQVEIAVESGTAPPTAAVNGPFASLEGSAVPMSAAGSTDPDGDELAYAWDFGDGSTATGASVTHTYAQNGVYTVRVVATDPLGLVDTATTTATVANVAPAVGALPDATLLTGETYQAAGAFTDPGADSWTATVDYGDGSGVQPLALVEMAFVLSHTYGAAGTFILTVRVTDDVTTSPRTATITVLTPVQGVQAAMDIVVQWLAGGVLDRGNANSLTVKLDAARRQLERDGGTPAVQQLEAVLNELDALVRSGRLEAAEAAALRELVQRVIAAVQ